MGKCNNVEFWGKLFQPVTWMLIYIVNKMIECQIFLLAHLSRRHIGELIGYSWSGVRPSVVVRRRSQCSKIFSSETAGPIKPKFYLELPWVGERYFVRGIWVT